MFVILFSVKANSSIYIVDNYSFKTSLKKIKNNRNKVIEDIKRKSLNDFLKSITIQSDYKNIKIEDSNLNRTIRHAFGHSTFCCRCFSSL